MINKKIRSEDIFPNMAQARESDLVLIVNEKTNTVRIAKNRYGMDKLLQEIEKFINSNTEKKDAMIVIKTEF